MTDNEIIKALDCCNLAHNCTNCPLKGTSEDCIERLENASHDLIKRQQAEIERHKGVIKILEKDVSTAKTDGIKQFSEKLKDYAWYYDVDMHALDRLEKEMLEAINGA